MQRLHLFIWSPAPGKAHMMAETVVYLSVALAKSFWSMIWIMTPPPSPVHVRAHTHKILAGSSKIFMCKKTDHVKSISLELCKQV